MQVQSSSECQFSFSTIMYSKLVIDSVNTGRRAIFFRSVNDPNCGYRNLVPGAVPKN
jgi:SET domain-containing protein